MTCRNKPVFISNLYLARIGKITACTYTERFEQSSCTANGGRFHERVDDTASYIIQRTDGTRLRRCPPSPTAIKYIHRSSTNLPVKTIRREACGQIKMREYKSKLTFREREHASEPLDNGDEITSSVVQTNQSVSESPFMTVSSSSRPTKYPRGDCVIVNGLEQPRVTAIRYKDCLSSSPIGISLS